MEHNKENAASLMLPEWAKVNPRNGHVEFVGKGRKTDEQVIAMQKLREEIAIRGTHPKPARAEKGEDAVIEFEKRKYVSPERALRRLRRKLFNVLITDGQVAAAIQVVIAKALDANHPEQLEAAWMLCKLRGLDVKQVAVEATVNQMSEAEREQKIAAFFGLTPQSGG